MLRPFLQVSAALTIMLLGNMIAPTVQAQTSTSPAQTGNPQSAPSTPNNATQSQISEADLQKFADALRQIHTLRQQEESQMQQILQQERFSPERFQQIAQMQQSRQPAQGNAPAPATPEVNIPAEEMQRFDRAFAAMAQIHQTTQTQSRQVVEQQGLNVTQFNQIMAEVRQNPEIQQQVIELLNRSGS